MVSRVLGCFIVAASLTFVGAAQKPAAAQVDQPVVQIDGLVVDSINVVEDAEGVVQGLVADVIVTLDVLGETVERTVQAPLDVSASAINENNNQDIPDGACAILHLSLGPIYLDVLGLVVELHDCDDGPVTVDVYAVEGQLLGDLLCGLLGELGLLDLDLDEILDGLLPGELDDLLGIIQGILDDLLEQIRDATEDVGDARRGPPPHAGQPGPPPHAKKPPHVPPGPPNDNDDDDDPERCDILTLEIPEGVIVNLLGLVVETSPICLEIYAERGEGNLLGNLLCAVVHLLDAPGIIGRRLDALLALVDGIRDAIGLIDELDELLEFLSAL